MYLPFELIILILISSRIENEFELPDHENESEKQEIFIFSYNHAKPCRSLHGSEFPEIFQETKN